MATLKTIRQAQVFKSCDICKLDLKVKWTCNQCKKFLCEECHQSHSTSTGHDVVSIYSVKAPEDDNAEETREKIPCNLHHKELCNRFCETCDETVCLSCTSGFHKGHTFKNIKKICSERIQIYTARIAKDLSFCEIEEKQMKETKEMYDSKFDDAMEKIRLKEEELKDEITKYANRLRNEMEDDKTAFVEKCSERETQNDNAKIDLTEREKRLRNVVQSKKTKDILKTLSEIKENLPDLGQHLQIEMKIFTDSDSEPLNLKDSFGSLVSTPLQTEESSIKFIVSESYDTDLNLVHRIVTTDRETAWISNYLTNTLHKINIEDSLSKEKDISFDLYDMALIPSKEILISALYSSDIKLLTKRGDIQPWKSVEHLFPLGIHATKSNDVIVGWTEDYSYDTVEESQRKIIIYGINGNQKQTFEKDKHGQRLFTLPFRIQSNINGDIVVIDDTSEFDGRLVVLNKDGNVSWIYHGNPLINSGDQLFHPQDLVSTSNGNIIIIDNTSSAFHVLSMTGDILFCKNMTVADIIWPISLDIDTKGQLWVGCYAEDYTSNAKLHVVNMNM